jgi:hypothetical protein
MLIALLVPVLAQRACCWYDQEEKQIRLDNTEVHAP